MNPEAQAVLDEILKIDPNSLTEDQIAFLRARRDYLKSSQVEEYRTVLEIIPSPEDPVIEEEKEAETSTTKAEMDARAEGQNKPTIEYEELLNRAKELGYTGKRIKRVELEAFIASKSE